MTIDSGRQQVERGGIMGFEIVGEPHESERNPITDPSLSRSKTFVAGGDAGRIADLTDLG